MKNHAPMQLFGGRIDCAKFALKRSIKLLDEKHEDSTLYREILDNISRRNQKAFTITLMNGQIDAMIFALETVIQMYQNKNQHDMALIYQDMLKELNPYANCEK